ncbi:DinB family protein [Sphingobacterium sp. ML3W]|uniref:DinB family protein n=1 Tax=Sphingobacterium sp. ML3W TaxID=1538644 RepID=UPI00249C51C6|nr:DinB family protein [Sphingobacterium sp. ML3W]WFA81618.1 DinB family protein [Sphingobacterium sp. ML3W]
MEYKSLALLEQLSTQTREHMAFVESLKTLSLDDLNKRPHKGSWNILECIAHLNLYGNFYLPEISRRMVASQSKAASYFSSGLLGNYFAKSILPKDRPNKMKTFQEMDPIYKQLDKNVLVVFLEQQENFLQLLEQAKSKDLNRIRTNISINKWIKIRLGDTFRFLVNHNSRHIVQIKTILSSYTAIDQTSQALPTVNYE